MPPKADSTNKQLEDMLARIAELERKDENNLKKIEELERNNADLERRIKTLEEKKTNDVLDFSKLFDKKGNKSSEEMKFTQDIIELNKETNKREKNVIIIGIPNSIDSDAANRKKFDEETVKKLFREISVDPLKIKKVHRFKNKDENSKSISQSSPLLVELPDSSEILKAAKLLRNSTTFHKVYINPDQNESERKLTKELVMKRNQLNEEVKSRGDLNNPFRYEIRNNEVKKFKAN
jgi:hypothetical protein